MMITAVALVFINLLSTATGLTHPHLPGDNAKWVNHGGDLTNRRWPVLETQISTSSVNQLRKRWSFTTVGNVTATPSISDGVVYFPDWAGGLYAVKQKTGALIWKKDLTALAARSLGPAGANRTLLSRSTPTIAGDRLLVGLYGPAAVLALNRSTGALLWSRLLDAHPEGVTTMSGTAYEGYFYMGTSSTEEGTDPTLCCNFQGAVYKLNIKNGATVWRAPMLPDNGGRLDQYAGNAVWGSSPPIDLKRRLVFVATGNNYKVPEEVEQCELNYRNLTNPPIPDPCIVEDNRAESVVAINIDTGNVTWSRHLGGYDTWTFVCSLGPDQLNCPALVGPDYDFGEVPLLLTIPSTNSTSGAFYARDIVVIGQKSGIVWALDRESGQTVWDTAAGPGGSSGGSIWGLTTDGKRVFTNIVNSGGQNFTLLPGRQVITTGGWVGLNATTGQVLWSTASPNGSWNPSPLTHVNGVVFGGSASLPGVLVGLDAKTGQILSQTLTNGSAYGGPSVAQGCAFQPLGVTFIGAIAASIARGDPLAAGNSVVSLCVPSASY